MPLPTTPIKRPQPAQRVRGKESKNPISVPPPLPPFTGRAPAPEAPQTLPKILEQDASKTEQIAQGHLSKSPSPRSRDHRILLSILIAVGLLLTCISVALLLVILNQGTQTNESESPARGSGSSRRLYTRMELSALVLGLNRQELSKILGPPDAIETPAIIVPGDERNEGYWAYHGLTINPATGWTDGQVYIWIRSGRVDLVTF